MTTEEEILSNQEKILLLVNQQNKVLNEKIDGLAATHQIILEILMSQSPQQKQAVAEGLSQILSRSEVLSNNNCMEYLKSILEFAQNPSRTSPEERRSWLHLVKNPESPQPE